MTLEEIKAKEFFEGLTRGREEGREEGLLTGLARGREEGLEVGLTTGLTNMLKGMLVSFKEEALPLESAYRFVSRNPECQSMSFEEVRDIWDSLS